MTKYWLCAGAAALAVATPAVAGNGHGNGNGGGHGGGHGEKQARGGERGDHGAKANRGSERGHAEQSGKRGHDDGERQARFDRGHEDRMKWAKRDDDRDNDDRAGRRWDDDRRRDDLRTVSYAGTRGLGDGCPPGLAKKNNGCLPPGQAKKLLGQRVDERVLARNALPALYQGWYRDDPNYLYRADGDYIYRIDRTTNLVSGLLPTFDTGYYPVGQLYPSDYNFYNVPASWQRYYPEQADYLYRYGDGAIYSVDPKTSAVSAIVALLANDLGVGQPLPSAYSTYNLPLSYRDRYVDGPNDWYRYSDGMIYRVDPTTQLVTAVVQALI